MRAERRNVRRLLKISIYLARKLRRRYEKSRARRVVNAARILIQIVVWILSANTFAQLLLQHLPLLNS